MFSINGLRMISGNWFSRTSPKLSFHDRCSDRYNTVSTSTGDISGHRCEKIDQNLKWIGKKHIQTPSITYKEGMTPGMDRESHKFLSRQFQPNSDEKAGSHIMDRRRQIVSINMIERKFLTAMQWIKKVTNKKIAWYIDMTCQKYKPIFRSFEIRNGTHFRLSSRVCDAKID